MKIGIDTSIVNINQAGSSTYASNLINEIKKIIPTDELYLFAVNHHHNMSRPKNVKSRIETIYRDIIWTHFQLPLKALREKIDVLHVPGNVSPFSPLQPTILTIFDTTIMQTPELFPYWHRNYTRFFLPLAAKKATIIVTISENSKRDIVKQFNVPPEKVVVTYLAASDIFKTVDTQEIERVKRLYNLESFILTVGSLEPRKNIPRLLQAYAVIVQKGFKHSLVHVGPQGWLFNGIFSEVERLGLNGRVRFLGHIPVKDLAALYNAASSFVYPSLYEGFGLPALEAMACGCPVITSTLSSLPEVVGDAGIMVDPYEISQIAEAIETICQNQQKAELYRNMGLQRAKMFSWHRCAKETVNAYHSAAKKQDNVAV